MHHPDACSMLDLRDDEFRRVAVRERMGEKTDAWVWSLPSRELSVFHARREAGRLIVHHQRTATGFDLIAKLARPVVWGVDKRGATP